MLKIKLFFILLLSLISIHAYAVNGTVRTDANDFIFIENDQDSDMYIGLATSHFDPRLTGSSAWVKYSRSKQISLGYAGMGVDKYLYSGYLLDIWDENSPIRQPYISQSCWTKDSGCNPATSTPTTAPYRVDNKGFYGLVTTHNHEDYARLSNSFYQYVKAMPVDSSLSRDMNVCYIKGSYGFDNTKKCVDQPNHVLRTYHLTHTKKAHIKVMKTDAFSDIFIDTNGNPTIAPGSKGCEFLNLSGYDGIACDFVKFDIKAGGPNSYFDDTKFKIVFPDPVFAPDSSSHVKISIKGESWSSSNYSRNVEDMLGHDTFQVFFSNRYLKKVISNSTKDSTLLNNLLYLEFSHDTATKSGYYEVSGSTTINVKPRDYAVSIISTDGLLHPRKEGKVGIDKLNFEYTVMQSAPVRSTSYELELSQDNPGTDSNGNCLFYRKGSHDKSTAVAVPAYIKFLEKSGSYFNKKVNCDNGIVSLNDIKEDTAVSDGFGLILHSKVNLIFDLRDPSLAKDMSGNDWEGNASQSGKVTLRAIWN
ncbi:hypothetical protein IHC92_18970 [Photobacterium damselae subsp. damselae]|uniref:hypothetical protein n=1 Tax=Photobacterium damselae TaxID=38293 RepID=UPI001F22EEE9|nr:hypothetical protein [Photobacterium damselae]UKA08559.1 hypothetical protein IHC90_16220 [Photobacterium damselae subsp. damselae]UKA23050.1 hypothetical protein IHC92_18970 [Photobacterium damselae subsp. damselae]